jgi:hypothetical protein
MWPPFGTSVSFGNNAIQFHNFPFASDPFTIGNVIFYPEGVYAGDYGIFYGVAQFLGRHEMAHTLQYEAWGPFFSIAYFASGPLGSVKNSFETSASSYAVKGGNIFRTREDRGTQTQYAGDRVEPLQHVDWKQKILIFPPRKRC